MLPIEDFKKYTLDLFLEEATERVKKEKCKVYCDILVSYPDVFDSLAEIFDYYSDQRRSSWRVNIFPCAEEDFYVVRFSPKERITRRNPIYFFWKTFRDDKYVRILSFSLHAYSEVHRTMDSLIRFARGLWFAWVGSRFLVNFDHFVRSAVGEETEVLASFQTTVQKGRVLPRKMRVYTLPPRKFVDLADIRKLARERYIREGEIHTFSNMRYRIISEEKGMYFTFSMTDRSRIMFENGDFTLFVTLLRPLLVQTRKILDVLRRKSYAPKRQSTIFGKKVEIASFDLIESLVFKRSKETRKWYEKIISLFSSDIPESKLMNFTLLSGNPYFLVHIVDVENSSSVYLSATSEELQIVPAESSTKEGTIAKIIDLIQAKVDPSISIE